MVGQLPTTNIEGRVLFRPEPTRTKTSTFFCTHAHAPKPANVTNSHPVTRSQTHAVLLQIDATLLATTHPSPGTPRDRSCSEPHRDQDPGTASRPPGDLRLGTADHCPGSQRTKMDVYRLAMRASSPYIRRRIHQHMLLYSSRGPWGGGGGCKPRCQGSLLCTHQSAFW